VLIVPTVVVTGAGGLIGSAVVRTLVGSDVTVRAHVGPPGAAAAFLPAGVPLIRADIDDAAAVRDLVAGAAAVVHLAGPASVAESFRDPAGFERAHVGGTRAVVDACRVHGVPRLVHVSSAEVYGLPAAAGPVDEDSRPAPRSPYAASKLAAEGIVEEAVDAGALTAVVLRPFSVYGARSPRSSLVGAVLRAVTCEPPAAVRMRSLAPVRDLVHVDDVAEAVRAAIDYADMRHLVVNVGTGVGTAVADLARLALDVAGRAHLAVEQHAVGDRPPERDVTHLVADTTRARDRLGWTATTDLRAGLTGILSGPPG
jgi:UDP-glucose 4-epimerase